MTFIQENHVFSKNHKMHRRISEWIMRNQRVCHLWMCSAGRVDSPRYLVCHQAPSNGWYTWLARSDVFKKIEMFEKKYLKSKILKFDFFKKLIFCWKKTDFSKNQHFKIFDFRFFSFFFCFFWKHLNLRAEYISRYLELDDKQGI